MIFMASCVSSIPWHLHLEIIRAWHDQQGTHAVINEEFWRRAHFQKLNIKTNCVVYARVRFRKLNRTVSFDHKIRYDLNGTECILCIEVLIMCTLFYIYFQIPNLYKKWGIKIYDFPMISFSSVIVYVSHIYYCKVFVIFSVLGEACFFSILLIMVAEDEVSEYFNKVNIWAQVRCLWYSGAIMLILNSFVFKL